MNRRTALAAATALGAVLCGCGETESRLLDPAGEAPTSVSWTEARPILAAYCVSCHGDFANQSSARAMTGEIVEKVADGTMPVVGRISPLPAAEKATLLAWARNP